MFIGMAVSTSKCMMSLHISGNLPYYERIFLRLMIAARVNFTYRHLTNKKKVRSNREKNVLLGFASGDGQEEELKRYINRLQDLDEKRAGLDFEI